MEFLHEIGVFLVEAIILVAAILVVLLGLAAIGARRRGGDDGYIEVRRLNERYHGYRDAIRSLTEHEESRKRREKAEKQEARERSKAAKKRAKGTREDPEKKRLFVLHFDGDVKASQVMSLREEISALLPEANERDEVLLCLESPGGMVHGYGLAASQLQRIKDAGIPLTIAVDKVAASGGYMMACVADRIIAAPFAVLGSIGVIAQLPNFHRLLKKHDVDYELLTAGEYKRTLTMFGENTDKGREKFLEDLESTHDLFKSFVTANRPTVDVAKVATGEVWYGQQALAENLIDELGTSDSYIQSQLDDADILEVRYLLKKSWQEKLGMAAEGALERGLMKVWQMGTVRQLP